jgi:Zn-dependent protease with chaperone function
VGGTLFAVVALVVFYGFTLALALGLALVPPIVIAAVFVIGISVPIYALILPFPFCWIPAYLLAEAVLTAKRRPFVAPGPLLKEAEFPLLFAELRSLASAAGVAVPEQVYVTHDGDAYVTELPGRKGRVLVLGCVVFEAFTLAELRAIVAHELAHFALGHTAYSGLRGHTWALFSSMAVGVERPNFSAHWSTEAGTELGRTLVSGLLKTYAWLYLRATLPGARRQELAADGMAARIAGKQAVTSALTKVASTFPIYDFFWENEVAPLVAKGVAPRDFLVGFARAREGYRERGLERELAEAVQSQRTRAFDTHPALTERLTYVSREDAVETVEGGDAPARCLLGDDVEALPVRVLERTPRAHELALYTYQELEQGYIPRTLFDEAQKLSAKLYLMFPRATTLSAMLVTVVELAQAGRFVECAHQWLPSLNQPMPPQARHAAVAQLWYNVLSTLAQGVLVERGASVDSNLGRSSFRLTLAGVEYLPGDVARAAATGDRAALATLRTWAEGSVVAT